MYSCFCGLPLRFNAIHHRIHQLQLLFGGTGQFFNHLLGVFCVETGQRFLQLCFALLRFGQNQKNFYGCPSFLRTGSIYVAGLVLYSAWLMATFLAQRLHPIRTAVDWIDG